MDKLTYITKQLSRTEKKRYEHYVITRIWHLLNDLEIKPITQQYIKRPSGRALTDLYFPQLKLHIEIDEKHHKHQIENDNIREKDIINATTHKILRIDVTQDIENINNQIDDIITIIKKEKNSNRNFAPWDIDKEQNSTTYVEKGYIDADEEVIFKKSVLALNCFGYNYKGFQRGGKLHKFEDNVLIWFPKTYKNKKWLNDISDDDIYIYEKSSDEEIRKKHIEKYIKSDVKTRIVFAQVRGPLGDIMYRFKGKYELDIKLTNSKNGLVWKRIATRVKTYKYLEENA